MLIDLTTAIAPNKINFGSKLSRSVIKVLLSLKKDITWHLGTHLDVMKKEFPLDYVERKAVVFDVSQVKNRDIAISDIDFDKVKKDMCIAFHSGCIEEKGYGSKSYFSKDHPQLCKELINKLLDRKISLIAVDFPGIRRGAEHIPTDQLCADNAVFVIENICNLKAVLDNNKSNEFIANTYPANYIDVTGLPCRMIAKV